MTDEKDELGKVIDALADYYLKPEERAELTITLDSCGMVDADYTEIEERVIVYTGGRMAGRATMMRSLQLGLAHTAINSAPAAERNTGDLSRFRPDAYPKPMGRRSKARSTFKARIKALQNRAHKSQK